MLPPDARNKLLTLFLLTNFNCSFFYKGNDSIDRERTLYPNTTHISADSFPVIFKVDKKDSYDTLFLNFKIQNPKSKSQIVNTFAKKVDEELEKNGINKENIFTYSVDCQDLEFLNEKFIIDEKNKFLQEIIYYKYKKFFKNIVFNAIYDGSMRVLAQGIIGSLIFNDQFVNNIVGSFTIENIHEVCFSHDDNLFPGLGKDKKWYNIDPSKGDPFLFDSALKKIKPKDEKAKESDLEFEDITDGGKNKKIDALAEEYVDSFFIKS